MPAPAAKRPLPPGVAARKEPAGRGSNPFPSGHQPFPPGFLWGTATASFQIEGYPRADGAGESIWDRFVHTPGKTMYGDTGDIACDHYHRWREDVKRMADLGLNAYRFSISWSRLLPAGTGRVNPAGVDFYSRLIDELLRHRITPMVTLFHWDYPQALQDRGGLLRRDSAEWFGDYAALCFRKYGDRVNLWLTLNEPEVFTTQGYSSGAHAPGIRDGAAMLRAGHNLLRGHGRAVQALRSISRQGKIGVAFALGPMFPKEDTFEDRLATRFAGASSRRFCDPILLAEYPPRFLQVHAARLPKGFEKDLKLISEPVDLIGCNYYAKWPASYEPSPFWYPRNVRLAVRKGKPAKPTPRPRLGYPEGLYETLVWARKRYGNYPMYITENNTAQADALGKDRRCHDQYRIDYLREHFRAARQAIAAGVDLRGYMVWTLMDNLEWGRGFSVRMGVFYTDYATQRRLWKDSAYWYRRVIKHNRVVAPSSGGRRRGQA